MKSDEAIAAAKEIADKNGWPWEPPVKAWIKRQWFIQRGRYWVVKSNANWMGRNVWVKIDDSTGKVVSSGFAPR